MPKRDHDVCYYIQLFLFIRCFQSTFDISYFIAIEICLVSTWCKTSLVAQILPTNLLWIFSKIYSKNYLEKFKLYFQCKNWLFIFIWIFKLFIFIIYSLRRRWKPHLSNWKDVTYSFFILHSIIRMFGLISTIILKLRKIIFKTSEYRHTFKLKI